MVFDYYHRLKKSDKAIYDRSDAIATVRLPKALVDECVPDLVAVRDTLSAGKRTQTERACKRLVTTICRRLGAPEAKIKVLARRPSDDWGELHGLYEPDDDDGRGTITVWMRTAARKEVVAPRSFVRTVLHELCHHLDYEYYELEESYHTEGFYKRESSLFKQLNRDDVIPSARQAKPRSAQGSSTGNRTNASDADRARELQVTKRGKFPESLRKKLDPDI